MTSPEGYTPQQIRHSYGLDSLSVGRTNLDGAGQTIAVIDAFDDPSIAYDLQQFDLTFGLPDPPSFQKTELVAAGIRLSPDASWAVQTSLDVEWAHALAPGANILLVEAADNAAQDLFAAAHWAAQQPGVSVVSMSFGISDQNGESSFDGDFTTPAGHQGVTFVAASGDRGNPDYPSNSSFGLYPALSPNVVGVGATWLWNDTAGNHMSEVAMEYSGGGYSNYEPPPAYQQRAGLNFASRVSPDVAFAGGDDSGQGLAIYDSYTNGTATPWQGVLGTSASTPGFAATIATADEGRALDAEGTLDGATQTLPLLYANPSAFHDMILGGNPTFQAGPGYDLVTGLGTPAANLLVPDLSAVLPLPAQATTLPTTPLVATGSYIAAAFLAVYARLPSLAELVHWEAQLNSGLSTGAFARDLVGSHEYYANEVVTPAYVKFLGRAPDAGGLAYWTSQLQGGTLTDEGLDAEVISSSEYFMRAGGTNELWVAALYQDLLGRQADSQGESYWVGQLQAGASRAEVADGFANASERLQKQISNDYLDILGRDPDSTGLDYWMAQLTHGATDEDLIAALIASQEFYDEHAI
jgi:hypothetical protein